MSDPFMVTSTISGSGFGLTSSTVGEELAVDVDGDILRVGGWSWLGVWAKWKGRRPSTFLGGEEDWSAGRGSPGLGEEEGDFGDFRGMMDGRPRRTIISFSVSIGEPFTDHSVIPSWRRWDRA